MYGDYWVDRPPLLIAFFALADHFGGAIPLRLMEIGTIIVSVLAAGQIGKLMSFSDTAAREARSMTGASAGALSAAVLLANPLFGTSEVNGELISVASILGSIAVGLTAVRTSAPTRFWWLALAGALATSAVLVKQNQLDAVIFLLGLVAVTGLGGAPGHRLRPVSRDLSFVALGVGATAVIVLAVADARGTAPMALWDAAVTFRMDAAVLLQSSSSPANDARFWRLLGTAVLAGVPLLSLHLLSRLRSGSEGGSRSRSTVGHDLRWVAVTVLAWETFSVLAGGSYWSHYLVCLVPGLVLAVSVAIATRASSITPHRLGPDRAISSPFTALAYCGSVTAVAIALAVANPSPGSTGNLTSTWLTAHAAAGDTGFVAYGQPNITQGAGLDSPYPYLWSLIVRVKDPQLALLASTLGGEDRPDWLITGPSGLSGWQIDPTAADEQLAEHYRQVATIDDYVIYLQRTRALS